MNMVDGPLITRLRKVSLRVYSACQGQIRSGGCWRERWQAGKQLGWPIAHHVAFWVVRRGSMEENKSCFHPLIIYTEEGSHTLGFWQDRKCLSLLGILKQVVT